MQKKIIFSLLDSPAFGGAEQYLFSHLRYLRGNGYKIVLATNNSLLKQEFFSRLSNLEKKDFLIIISPYKLDAIGDWKGLVKFFISLPRSLAWCYIILRRLKKQGDVICLWPGFSDRLVFSPIARSLKCKLVWIEMGPLSPVFKRNLGFPKFLYKITKRLPSLIVTISKSNRADIARNANVPTRSISLVYPGTQTFSDSQLAHYKKAGDEWRSKKNLVTRSIITVVGRLAHENDIDNVINAFSVFLDQSTKTNTTLMVVGTGPQKNELVQLIHDLGIEKYVKLTGFVSEEEKRVILSASNFFIFPRAWDWDGFGMTTIEAMAIGLPVLTPGFGPQKEIITDGLEGFFYTSGDVPSLAGNIEKLLVLSPKRLSQMRNNSLSRANFFSEDKSQSAMLRVIKSLY